MTDQEPTAIKAALTAANDAVGALLLYGYSLGGNTRTMAIMTGIDQDEIIRKLWRANHIQALKAAGITEDEWRAGLTEQRPGIDHSHHSHPATIEAVAACEINAVRYAAGRADPRCHHPNHPMFPDRCLIVSRPPARDLRDDKHGAELEAYDRAEQEDDPSDTSDEFEQEPYGPAGWAALMTPIDPATGAPEGIDVSALPDDPVALADHIAARTQAAAAHIATCHDDRCAFCYAGPPSVPSRVAARDEPCADPATCDLPGHAVAADPTGLACH